MATSAFSISQAAQNPLLEPTLSLSPSIAYYIRRLLRQKLNQLKYVVAPGAGIKADWLSDLNAVIASLYLDSDSINSTVEELERLTLTHQALSAQSGLYPHELQKQEKQIFWLLGFKYQ